MIYQTHVDENGEILPGPFFRTPFNYNIMEASNETALVCPEPTLTQQQFKDETDINVIVERFGVTGQLPDAIIPPTYGDYTNVPDFQTALNVVLQAEEAFMELPAKIRQRFGNDPQQYLEFCEDGSNREEAKRLGILRETVDTVDHGGSTPHTPNTVTKEDK